MLFLLGLMICGSSYAHWDNSFTTEVTPKLKFAGVKCKGGEASGVTDRLCQEGQWLFGMGKPQMDELVPFIVKLKSTGYFTTHSIGLYEIIPKDRVTSDQRRLLGRYLVRFNFNADPTIIRRDGLSIPGI